MEYIMKSHINYRAEIDGLRAISVIGVLFYHAGLSFPGGYVGVDVFFVISGFLITSIIFRGIQNETFSMSEFWGRRIKRILPAVSALIIAVLIAGTVILDPASLISLAESAFSQCTMWANFYFNNASTGYFHAKTELMPLLHMWSLSVEEQFYLFLPLLLVLLFKYLPRYVFPVLVATALFSFVLSIFITQSNQSQAFYLLHTRAWELLAGTLLALGNNKVRMPKITSEILAMTGLTLIIASMFILNIHSVFPGLNALFPVAGAVVFIAATGCHPTLAGRLLSIRPIVFIGLISYSLYLWHWPLFAFSRHLMVDADTLTVKLLLLVLSIVLGYLSWRFIETPFRRKDLLTSNRSAVRFGIGLTAVLMLACGILIFSKGIPGRFNDTYSILLKDMEQTGRKYRDKGAGIVLGQQENTKLDFILWGDSHGMASAAAIDREAKEQNRKGIAYLNTGTLPVINLHRPGFRKNVAAYNEKVFESILASDVKNLILISRWNNYLNDHPLTDQTGTSSTPQEAAAALSRQLTPMLKKLKIHGIKVYLIKQTPETENDMPAKHFFIRKRFPALNPSADAQFTKEIAVHYHQTALIEELTNSLQENGLAQVIDPAPAFFDNPLQRLEVYSERSHFRDSNHLTAFGAERFMRPCFSEIFGDMKRSLSMSKPVQ